ncbi:hypothetical protein SESBI_05013 [Sesbania bispinosa]|nr:hypothetical protein SESBI_05013 [Sesbania bispinosa]
MDAKADAPLNTTIACTLQIDGLSPAINSGFQCNVIGIAPEVLSPTSMGFVFLTQHQVHK